MAEGMETPPDMNGWKVTLREKDAHREAVTRAETHPMAASWVQRLKPHLRKTREEQRTGVGVGVAEDSKPP